MRILCWGTYDTGKPRTRILREGLRAVGVIVDECHVSVWEGIEDKSQVKSSLYRIWLLLRWMASYPALIYGFMRAPRPDAVLVGFPGVLDAIVLAPFAQLRGIPVIWDMFMSLYDTVAVDRRMLSPTGLPGRLLRAVERFAVHRCDLVLLDTDAHARRIESLFSLPAEHCCSVWVGAELQHFTAQPAVRTPGSPLKVLFYGQFIPLHGVETIVRAARELQHEPVEWTLIGKGQEASVIRQMLDEIPLPRLRWIDWVSYTELQHSIAAADLCLGIFGTSEKAASVIPNKVFQIAAAGKPFVTRDSAAIRELVRHNTPCTYLVPPGDAIALANAVREHVGHVQRSERQPLCHASLRDAISSPAIGRQFTDIVARELPHLRLADAR